MKTPSNRWFIDTEFLDDGKEIILIAIALVSEDMTKSYYAVSADFDRRRATKWLRKHVLPKLKGYPCMPNKVIATEIADLVGENPEFWGYCSAYDWVALCQLNGPLVNRPKGWPSFCRDLKQEMARLGLKRKDLPKAPRRQQHNALNDAVWNLKVFNHLCIYAASAEFAKICRPLGRK